MDSDNQIKVVPGCVFGASDPYTITLTRVASVETPEEYAKRCQDITNYAAQRSAHLHRPEVFNFDDRSKWKQVGESAYEMIDSGLKSPE